MNVIYKIVKMAGNLTFEERKWILKEYWKSENISEVGNHTSYHATDAKDYQKVKRKI